MCVCVFFFVLQFCSLLREQTHPSHPDPVHCSRGKWHRNSIYFIYFAVRCNVPPLPRGTGMSRYTSLFFPVQHNCLILSIIYLNPPGKKNGAPALPHHRERLSYPNAGDEERPIRLKFVSVIFPPNKNTTKQTKKKQKRNVPKTPRTRPCLPRQCLAAPRRRHIHYVSLCFNGVRCI